MFSLGIKVLSMSKVIVYIATSVDGFIAGKNDDMSWLEKFEKRGRITDSQSFSKLLELR